MITRKDSTCDTVRTQSSPNCLVCKAPGKLLYSNLPDGITAVKGKWHLKQCVNSQCASIWLDPSPIKEDIYKLYDNYITHPVEPTKKTFLKKILERILLIFLYSNPERKYYDTMYLSNLKPGRLLDIGCGDGQRLIFMKSKGWDVIGQEIDPKAAAFSLKEGFKIYLGDLPNLKLPENHFDVIIMNHVIEHLLDPLAILTECHRILKKNGHLIIITPNSQALTHFFFKNNWIGLDPPRHIFIFSKISLNSLGLKAGFSKCNTWTTYVNSFCFSLWSFLLQNGKGREFHKRHVGALLKAAIFTIIVSLISLFANKDNGDECVLFATK